jgi:hypothetical protein
MYNVDVQRLTNSLASNIFDDIYSKIKNNLYRFDEYVPLKNFCGQMHDAIKSGDFDRLKQSIKEYPTASEDIKQYVKIMALINRRNQISQASLEYLVEQVQAIGELSNISIVELADKFETIHSFCAYFIDRVRYITDRHFINTFVPKN